MSTPLAPGLSAQLTMTVTRAHSADTLGNTGVAVFATPFLIAFLENASNAVLKPYFAPGGGSVGTMWSRCSGSSTSTRRPPRGSRS